MAQTMASSSLRNSHSNKLLDEAASLFRGGDYERAAVALTELLRSSPQDFQARYELGRTYTKLGRVQEAAETFRLSLKERPTSHAALHELGRTLHRLGNFREAATRFEEALRSQPGQVASSLALAQSAMALCEPERALEPLKKVRTGEVAVSKAIEKIESAVAAKHNIKPLPVQVKSSPPKQPPKKKEASPKEKAAASPRPKMRVPLPFYGISEQSFLHKEVVFTCVVGQRHKLSTMSVPEEYERALYIDREIEANKWQSRPLMFWDANPKLITLFHKYAMASFAPVGTKFVWLDSRISLSTSVMRTIMDSLDNYELCLFKHYERDCIYEEVLAVLAGKRASLEQCSDFSSHIRSVSFPRHAGLYETGVIGFRVSENIQRLFRQVFALCYRYVPRDQLTLPLALKQTPVKVHLFGDGDTHLRNSPGIEVKSWKGND